MSSYNKRQGQVKEVSHLVTMLRKQINAYFIISLFQSLFYEVSERFFRKKYAKSLAKFEI